MFSSKHILNKQTSKRSGTYPLKMNNYKAHAY